jgi:IclR family mhp operon transcriptional activator
MPAIILHQEETAMDSSQQLRSLKRGLEALSMMNDTGMLTVTDLARRMRVPRTTAHRILDTLVGADYAERIPNAPGYRLTPLVRSLSHGFDDEWWITRVAEPLLTQLAQTIRWPLALTTPRGDKMLIRVCTDHDSPLALSRFRPGYTTPMMYTTAGHVYLAFSSPEQRKLTLDVILSSPDPLQSPARDTAGLNDLFARIRSDGFLMLERSELAQSNIAVPVLVKGKPIACITMRFIKSALKPHQVVSDYLPALQTAAGQVADYLTHQS